MPTTIDITLPRPHEMQRAFIESPAKRKVIRAGRRSGKTVGIAILALRHFLEGGRVLYATPTMDQIDRFWVTCKLALNEPIGEGLFYKNETLHVVELAGTEQRIRAKTAYNADTLRGDYASLLILDEWQLMSEDAWELVGAPMMLDTDGDAIFIYTPPGILARSISRAKDKRHAAKLFAKASEDTSGRWETFHFRSHDNPYLSRDALEDIAQDMTSLAYRQEILAEDLDEVPGALWTRGLIESCRVILKPAMVRIVVAIDPAGGATATSNETGIIVAGEGEDERGYLLEDCSGRYSPDEWGRRAVQAYHQWQADCIIAEKNQGGDMVRHVLSTVDRNLPIKLIHASRGKGVRAEPVVALYEQHKVSHVGEFPFLEEQLCTWIRGDASPDRLDALVHGLTELMLGEKTQVGIDLL